MIKISHKINFNKLSKCKYNIKKKKIRKLYLFIEIEQIGD